MSDAEHADWCHVVIGCIEPNHCTCETDLFGCNPPISETGEPS